MRKIQEIEHEKKTIGMVLDTNCDFPPDIRVEKEASALINAGFNVTIITIKRNQNQPSKEILDYGLKVFRYNVDKSNRYLHPFEALTFIRRKWSKVIEDFIKLEELDILHAHDLPILPTVLRLGKKYDLAVVADLHENMPASVVASRSNLHWLRKLISLMYKNYFLWQWYEKCALKKCIRIIVVVPEATKRLITKYKINSDKICIVSNTEDETTFNTLVKDDEIIQKYINTWTALYIGGVGPHRGLDTSIKAAAIAGKTISNFKLLIVGIKSNDQKERIINFARKSNATQFLELIDWVPIHKVNSYIAASKVCLVPYNDFEHTNTTVPHKLFQYMIMRKPVIVSDCAPLKRIVEDTKCGLIFIANRSEDLASNLIKLSKLNKQKYLEYGENGYSAAIGKYSWKNDNERLVNMYKKLLNSV